MKSYQIIILIGSVLGLLVTLSAGFVLFSLHNYLDENNVQRDNSSDSSIKVSVVVAFIAYILVVVLSFITNNTKIIGSLSILTSFVVFGATGGFGIIGFIFLLIGGVVALVYKKDQQQEKIVNTNG